MGRIVLTLALLLAADAALADTTGRVYAPGEDAYVLKSTPSASHVDNVWLPSGVGFDRRDVYRSFVRFSLPRRGRVVSAVLKGMLSGSARGLYAFDFVADDGWTPSTLNWDNQPAVSSERIATVDAATTSVFYEMSIDVTELVQREQSVDGWISMRIAASDETIWYQAAKWRGRGDANDRGFHLELVVSPAPALEPGDIVTMSGSQFFTGVVAIDPEEGTQKGLAPIRYVGRLRALNADPRDGTLIAADGFGFVRIDLTGNPSTLPEHDPQSSWWPLYVDWSPSYLAVSSDGHLYATREFDVPSVVRVDSDSGTREVVASGGELCMPTGIALDGTDLLVADYCGKLIRIDAQSGAQSVVPVVGRLYAPEGIALASDGSLLLADGDVGGGGRLVRIDLATGVQAIVAELPFVPGPLAVDQTGTIWVGSATEHCWSPPCAEAEFGRIDPILGTYTQIFRRAEGLGGIALDADGAPLLALMSGNENGRVVRIDPATGAEQLIAAPLSVERTYQLLFDEQRQLVAVQADRIVRLDPISGHQSIVATGTTLDCGPLDYCWILDAALAPDGRLVVLRKVQTLESISDHLLWIDPKSDAVSSRDLDWWTSNGAIVVERSGAVLVAGINYWGSSGLMMIRRIDPFTGVASVLASGGLLQGSGDLALDVTGTVLVNDPAHRQLLRVDPETGAVAVAVSDVRSNPEQFVIDAHGRILGSGLLAGQQWALQLFDPSSGALVKLATGPEPGGSGTFAVFEPPCANGIDDDGDGLADLADPGCANASARREDPQCNNGRDDDHDGKIDLDDPNCTSPAASESGCGIGAELSLLLTALRFLRARSRRLQG
jgi:sugar lactone lactonase YvrE